uniref:Lunapark zinc ribbon domain-containing protein n=1 Tax=Setaria italica TaxID=4555 RepID=K3Y8B9_SETIT
MASPAEAAEMVASAAAASEAKGKEEKEKRDGPGILGRIWRALFGGRGEDYEKRLQNLSKEEAALLARMRRRTQFSRRGVRNLIALSVLGEVPQFASLFALFTSVKSDTRMLERKDKDTLERLRAERKAKIDELKDRTNYYLTQELIQKYDLDPAAKAAAASVLASKMGAETGLKLHMGDEAKSGSTQARSNEVEVVPKDGLRNRRETKAKGSSYSSTAAAHTGGGMEAMPPSKVVGHYEGSGTSDGGWIAKIAALLVGEDPSQSYALICGNCHMHNGLARKEDFPHVTYYCPHCHALNVSNQSIGQCSGQLSPVAPADGVSTTHPITETELSSKSEVQELPEVTNAGQQPVEPAN